MTCANAIAAASDRILVGVDSIQTGYDRDGKQFANGEAEKTFVISEERPFVLIGRGLLPVVVGLAHELRRKLELMELPADDLARKMSRFFRQLAFFRRSFRRHAGIEITIAGFDAKGEAFVREFRQANRDDGFEVQQDGPTVAPWARDIERYAAAVDDVPSMRRLLVQQVELLRSAGFVAGPPLVVLDLRPGRIERHVFNNLNLPSPRQSAPMIIRAFGIEAGTMRAGALTRV